MRAALPRPQKQRRTFKALHSARNRIWLPSLGTVSGQPRTQVCRLDSINFMHTHSGRVDRCFEHLRAANSL